MDILPCVGGCVHLDNKIKHIKPLVVCCVLCVVCCVVCGVWCVVWCVCECVSVVVCCVLSVCLRRAPERRVLADSPEGVNYHCYIPTAARAQRTPIRRAPERSEGARRLTRRG